MASQERHAKRISTSRHGEGAYAQDLLLLTEALTPTLENGKPVRTSLGQLPCTPAAVDAACDNLVDRLLPTLAAHLKSLERLDLGVDSNRELANSINQLLKRLKCGLVCPHCNELAYALRYVRSGTARNPVFKYDHRSGGPHGGTTNLSTLTIVRERSSAG